MVTAKFYNSSLPQEDFLRAMTLEQFDCFEYTQGYKGVLNISSTGVIRANNVIATS